MADARYYIRVRGKVLGPFDVAQLRKQRDRGQLSRFHEISEDRITWVPASKIVELFPAEGSSSRSRGADPEGITGVAPSGGDGGRDTAGAMWHYTNLRGKQVGPVTREHLLALLDEGTIDAQTLVWNPSLEEWVPMETVPGLLPEGADGKGRGGLRFSLGLASVVAAVVWACGLGSVAAVVLGVLALRQARAKRDPGARKMALAGLIAGAGGLVLSLVVGVIALIYAFSGPTTHTPDQISAEYRDRVYRVEYTEGKVTYTGSAILLANDSRRGLMATNLHVVDAELMKDNVKSAARKLLPESSIDKKWTVEVSNPSQLHAKKANVAAFHRDLDLALLLIESDNAPPDAVRVARQDKLHDGEAAVAMGYPLGVQLNTTPGIISNHRGESGQVWTTCPISPGNSGGPLFLQRGGLLAGLNSGTFVKGQNFNGAVPAEQIVSALREGRTDNWVWAAELREDVIRLAKMVPLAD
jgi:S1-C subfamily serine protease